MNDAPVRTRSIATANLEARLDELFDLLADDALDDGRRAALLRSLDEQPDQRGWRRCALALLEAQAWRRAVAAEVAHVKPPKGNAGRRAAVVPRLAVAAVIAAFTAGIFLGGSSWRRTGPGRQVVQGESTNPRPSESPTETDLITRRAASAASELAGSSVNGSADVRQDVMPDYVRRRLEREGYEVQGGGAKVIPVELPDGRRVNVPVETLRYQYVGRRVR